MPEHEHTTFAEIQTIALSLITSLHGAHAVFEKKYRNEAQFEGHVQKERIYLQQFSSVFLSFIALVKEIDNSHKLEAERAQLEWIEAYAGHIYQQVHDELLPFLERQHTLRAEDKRWETFFWAQFEAAMKVLAQHFDDVEEDVTPSLSKQLLEKCKQVLPRFSFAQFLRIRERTLRKSVVVMCIGLAALAAACIEHEEERVGTQKDRVTVSEKQEPGLKKKELQVTFEDTNERTSKSRKIFKIVGEVPPQPSQEVRLTIAREFNKWSSAQGHRFNAAGWRNVRSIRGELCIVAGAELRQELKLSRSSVYAKGVKGYLGVASVGSAEERAILDTIAWAEGVRHGDDGYRTIYGGQKILSNLTDHPRKIIKGRINSSAAGRYQFMPNTWDGIPGSDKLTFSSPKDQDKAALYLLKKKRGVSRNDLKGALENNDFSNVARKINKEWASIPNPKTKKGAYKGQKAKNLKKLMGVFRKALEVQKRK